MIFIKYDDHLIMLVTNNLILHFLYPNQFIVKNNYITITRR